MRLIDADALKETLSKEWNYNLAPIIFKQFETLIDNAPTVKPTESELVKAYTKGFDTGVETVKSVRPQGEWKHEIICDKSCVLCSICNLHFDNESNFCPNCGADMRKGGAE